MRTGTGELWHVDAEGRSWRAPSWVPGRTLHGVADLTTAREAGAMVARWHEAVSDLDHRFSFSRPGAHDTEAHMAALRDSLDRHPTHRLRDAVAPLADRILRGWDTWSGRMDGPVAISHGDLKISNLRFDDTGHALCLLDLDTMGRLPLDIELGDAWRSWCNPRGEDTAEPDFSVDVFRASARGYLGERDLARETREALPGGIERICLELAARFAADASNETYFGWNPAIGATRGDHNLLRARGQLRLGELVRAQRASLDAVLT